MKDFYNDSFLRISADLLQNPDMIGIITNTDNVDDEVLLQKEKLPKKKRTLKLSKDSEQNKKAL